MRQIFRSFKFRVELKLALSSYKFTVSFGKGWQNFRTLKKKRSLVPKFAQKNVIWYAILRKQVIRCASLQKKVSGTTTRKVKLDFPHTQECLTYFRALAAKKKV